MNLQQAIRSAQAHAIMDAIICTDPKPCCVCFNAERREFSVYSQGAWTPTTGGLLPWPGPPADVVVAIVHADGTYDPGPAHEQYRDFDDGKRYSHEATEEAIQNYRQKLATD